MEIEGMDTRLLSIDTITSFENPRTFRRVISNTEPAEFLPKSDERRAPWFFANCCRYDIQQKEADKIGAEMSILFFALDSRRELTAPNLSRPASKAHQSRTGTSQCASCHQFDKLANFQCPDCQRSRFSASAAKPRLSRPYPDAQPNGKECVH